MRHHALTPLTLCTLAAAGWAGCAAPPTEPVTARPVSLGEFAYGADRSAPAVAVGAAAAEVATSDLPTTERQHFVSITKPSAIRVGRLKDIRHDDPAILAFQRRFEQIPVIASFTVRRPSGLNVLARGLGLPSGCRGSLPSVV